MMNFVLNDRKRRMNDRWLALARAAFVAAVAERPAARFIIRSRTRVVKRTRRGIGEWRPRPLAKDIFACAVTEVIPAKDR
jgi:hypothetical protein